MTPTVDVFGFGSCFVGDGEANDIDFLLIHDDTSKASCALAINCKRYLLQIIDDAHITMLSKGEERHFDFVKTARAKELGTIRDGSVELDVERIWKASGLTRGPRDYPVARFVNCCSGSSGQARGRQEV